MISFLFSLSFSHLNNSACGHQQLSRLIKPKQLNITSSRRVHDSDSWKNIRLQFDYVFLDRQNDIGFCRQVGQVVKLIDGTSKECTRKDLVTQTQIDNLKITFNNLKEYFQKLLYVIPMDDFESEVEELDIVKTFTNTDLYITVRIQPYGAENTIAAATATRVQLDYARPLLGIVVVNPKHVPQNPSNISDKDNYFFHVVAHELTHVLGFSPNFYNYFHPHESTKAYNKILCWMYTHNYNRTYLVTPFAHLYAQKRFGVENFQGDKTSCPAGIEIEDAGGDGTTGAHLEARVYNSEYMVGQTIAEDMDYIRISDATLAVLLDTGNYKVDWRYARPLIWGNPKSINGKVIEDFWGGPPQKVFPSGYIGILPSYDYTLFNFKGIGIWDDITVNFACSKAPNACSFFKDFVDPLNTGYMSANAVYDYMLFKSPLFVCDKGQAVIPGNPLECYDYTCDGTKSFTMKIKTSPVTTQEITCDSSTVNKENTYTYTFANGTRYPMKLTCPDPERFCRTVDLHENNFKENPFDSSSSGEGPCCDPAPDAYQKQGSAGLLSPGLTALVVIIIIGVIAAIAFGAFILYKKNFSHHSDGGEP